MYSVYYVVIVTGIGAIFLREKTHIKNNIWYGNELSEYDTVQSTVLVEGRRYLTVVCCCSQLFSCSGGFWLQLGLGSGLEFFVQF